MSGEGAENGKLRVTTKMETSVAGVFPGHSTAKGPQGEEAA